MSMLAIKGHATRGREIIEILEMLGGKNITNLNGEYHNMIYIINSSYYGEITYMPYRTDAYIVFTLEEFLEKFPYKVGDKVIVKGYKQVFEIFSMRWCSERNDVMYSVSNGWFYTEELQPYKEETIEEIKVDIPKGYEFAGVDDNKQQVVFTKIQPQYPKTYEECCKVLGVNPSFDIRMLEDEESTLYFNFIDLVRCRNAYWKIAGEQMGLGKPWKPSKNDNVYCIFRLKGEIVKDNFVFSDSLILEFPTEEMRDVFYENFKKLIETVKELL